MLVLERALTKAAKPKQTIDVAVLLEQLGISLDKWQEQQTKKRMMYILR
ncbi:hypothetical protein [Paenibacillus spongiae]|uniref:Uncharacterized protein n=1 Tax=Paenibacillus spongiae TaxID=2909671 RepID=A0ABY5SCB9_9BACL|nr:hypothetical protein [Paenibacillus spongiae]UVI31599.1 hypothetical protein L1F29_07200 [Paenibacillus spongiae]